MATATSEKTYSIRDANGLRNAIAEAVRTTPITDLHTHLYAPAFGDLLLYGIDELLTYHYLVAEYSRTTTEPYEAFWALSKSEQADRIWQALFIERAPLSEACRGVLTVLARLGLDTSTRDLNAYRAWFAAREPEAHLRAVFEKANLKCAVMTNDPFDDTERPVWETGYEPHPLLHAVLRMDPLLNDWENAWSRLQGWGYDVSADIGDANTQAGVRKFIEDWTARMQPLYMAVSLPPDFEFPEHSARATLLQECVLPVAREHNLPFAMMIGVTRQVNPALRLAGDGVGTARLAPLEYLCANYPQNKFMTTYLARENQHALCVAARKFRNLMLFGCWWFLNNPSLIEEMTRMRVELLGPTFVPQHSDARVLEQVIYKWDHSREILTRVLRHKYADLIETGWTVTQAEIERDIARLVDTNFWDFVEARF